MLTNLFPDDRKISDWLQRDAVRSVGGLDGCRLLAAMHAFFDRCLVQGSTFQELWVIDDNDNAIKRYERYGFKFDREILDYSHDADFADDDLYFNSFFLNLRGRKAFTRRVLRDIGLAGEFPPDVGGEMGEESSEK